MRRLLPALLTIGLEADAQWVTLPDFPGTARDDASAFAIGTDIHVGTGMEIGWGLTTDWYCFNTLDETWRPIASLPATGRQYGTAFTIDGIGYLFGGVDAGGWLDELWAYDPIADAWTQKASLPAPGRSGSAAFTLGGFGYVATGRTGPDQAVTQELWRYDPATDSWLQRTSLPGTARLLASAFALDDQGHIVGGQNWAGTALNDGWRYDPVTDAWSPIATCLDARYGGDGFSVAGQGFVVGGVWSPNVIPANTLLYDAGSDTWSYGPFLNGVTVRKGGAGAVVGSSVYYGTGISGDLRLKDWVRTDFPSAIAEASGTGLPRVFPNPAADVLHLTGTDASQVRDARIMDMQGRIVRPLAAEQLARPIPLAGCASGSLLLVVRTEAGPLRLPFIHAGE
ncbi:MAG: hypothetical protein JST66_09065 [Bacteroidetes bacterium]|nr:hypothetical protein [Bacteroidota bacterium]